MRICLLLLVCIASAQATWAQHADRMDNRATSKTVLGQRNPALFDGAQALLAGDHEEGVRLTHQGLKFALGRREEEAALSNLCAGYVLLQKYDEALTYCEILLERNDKHWRAYNNRAVIYIKTKQWEKADQDLSRGEELNPGAHTMKVARALYMDAVHPVAPEIEIDDRERESGDPTELL